MVSTGDSLKRSQLGARKILMLLGLWCVALRTCDAHLHAVSAGKVLGWNWSVFLRLGDWLKPLVFLQGGLPDSREAQGPGG